MNLKPMLAEDWVDSLVKFPVEIQPKVDGVRSLHLTGKLTGRSFKPHANKHVTAKFSPEIYTGLDGEMHCGNPTDKALCRVTSSLLRRIQGEPDVRWMLFDYIVPETLKLGYTERHAALSERITQIADSNLWLVPTFTITNMADLLSLEDVWLAEGYEGVILRDPNGLYKSGRSTPLEGGLLRIKRFVEEDAIVTGIVEGQSNNNEAVINELGRTERSTHQENMVPNGMVGALECIEVKTGLQILVSPGEMTHEERVMYFNNPELIVGKTISFRHLPTGRKTFPRFPTFKSIRGPADIV